MCSHWGLGFMSHDSHFATPKKFPFPVLRRHEELKAVFGFDMNPPLSFYPADGTKGRLTSGGSPTANLAQARGQGERRQSRTVFTLPALEKNSAGGKTLHG